MMTSLPAAEDPCKDLANSCEYGCTNQSGVATCYCRTGYSLAADNATCAGGSTTHRSNVSIVSNIHHKDAYALTADDATCETQDFTCTHTHTYTVCTHTNLPASSTRTHIFTQ